MYDRRAIRTILTTLVGAAAVLALTAWLLVACADNPGTRHRPPHTCTEYES